MSFDITNDVFSDRSADCGYYVGPVENTATDSACTIDSNSIPNHDFAGDDANFSTPTAEVT